MLKTYIDGAGTSDESGRFSVLVGGTFAFSRRGEERRDSRMTPGFLSRRNGCIVVPFTERKLWEGTRCGSG